MNEGRLLVPGDVINDKYEVVSLLGVGGMGEVYKVRHMTLDVMRCIKLLKSSLLKRAAHRRRFVREARIATRIQHPNVAMVHDFDVTADGQYYLVSELIDGVTIREWRERHSRFPVDLAVFVISQVLSGLGYIHAHGLLHRDISADNVMLTVDHDGRAMAKIIDLGVAKEIDGSTESSLSTRLGHLIGNPKYASPEQLGALDENEHIDHRADLYCVAVVLYEMLAGVAPFTSSTVQGYRARHLMETPPAFREVDPGIELPEGLESAIFKALEKERNRRFSSAEEFKRALRRHVVLQSSDAVHYARQIEADLPLSSRRTENLIDIPLPKTVQAPLPRAGRSTGPAQTTGEAGSANECLGRAETASGPQDPTWQRYLQDWTGSLEKAAAGLRQEQRSSEESDEDRAWNVAYVSGTSEAWKKFLREYPGSARVEMTRWLMRETQEFEKACVVDSVVSWRKFLAYYGTGRYGSAAREQLNAAIERSARADEEALTATVYGAAMSEEERSDLEFAIRSGTSAGWIRFLEFHPSSLRAPEAKKRLEEARDFERARESRSLDDLRGYLRKWRSGPHAADVRSLIERQLSSARGR